MDKIGNYGRKLSIKFQTGSSKRQKREEMKEP